jgi:hypothetical protein
MLWESICLRAIHGLTKSMMETLNGINGLFLFRLAAILIGFLGSLGPFFYMPSETDLYFPIGDARYDLTFLNEKIGRFLRK